MSASHASRAAFILLQIDYEVGTDGGPVRHAAPRGAYLSAEGALEQARRLAEEAAQRLEEDPAGRVDLVDTEWGYDLLQDGLMIARFWVYDAEADQPLLAGS